MAEANTTVVAAFAVGVASFVSPCVLPLVPGYISSVSGVSIDELRGRERPIGRVLWPAVIFCLSFTVLFVALGMTATGIGSTLADHRRLLDQVAGVVIIALGLLFVLAPVFPRLAKEWRPEALVLRAGGGPVLAGAAFAVAWTPCIGPTLGAILTAAATSDSAGQGGVLLAFYSLGLAVPFLVTAVAFDRATTAFRWLRNHYVVVTAVSGAVLIAMGVLMLTGELTTLNVEAQRLMQRLGLDFLYSF
jgi:cytochrome c-type biogenesis protein